VVKLLEKAPELLRETLVDRRVQLGTDKVVRVGEEDRSDHVVTQDEQQSQVYHHYACYIDEFFVKLLDQSYNDHQVQD
jgi:hypothetical protein